MDSAFEEKIANLLELTNEMKGMLGSKVADAFLYDKESLGKWNTALEYLSSLQWRAFQLAKQVGFSYEEQGKIAVLPLQGKEFRSAFLAEKSEFLKESDTAPETVFESSVANPFNDKKQQHSSSLEGDRECSIPLKEKGEEIPTSDTEQASLERKEDRLFFDSLDTNAEDFFEQLQKELQKTPKEESTEEYGEESNGNSTSIGNSISLEGEEPPKQETPQESESLKEETVSTEESSVITEEPLENSAEEEIQAKEHKEVVQEEPSVFTEESSKPEPPKVQIIGESKPTINAVKPEELFIEEKEKDYEEFVFECYTGVVTRYGGRPEDIHFTIAPLKIYKHERSSVPILVVAQYNDRVFVSSTYDNADGRNTVVIAVDDFSFLCRGYVNEAGVFCSNVSTTGMSVENHDILNMVRKESHCPIGNEIRNGHIKFKYDGDEGEGIAEVFVLSDEEEYMLITRTGPILDYYPISVKTRNSLNKAVLFCNGGKKTLTVKEEDGIVRTQIE